MATRTRDPDGTRERLLEAAFGEIYERGYNAASMDQIVERSGVTKGALYHHFGSKKALAQAVIDSVIRKHVVESFLGPLGTTEDPVTAIQECIAAKLGELTPEMISCGCPLNNLAQELSGTDDDFQAQIDQLYTVWRAGLSDALKRGLKAGTLRPDVDVDATATFLVSVIAGSAGFAKSARNIEVARTSMRILSEYLETLRPTTQ